MVSTFLMITLKHNFTLVFFHIYCSILLLIKYNLNSTYLNNDLRCLIFDIQSFAIYQVEIGASFHSASWLQETDSGLTLNRQN